MVSGFRRSLSLPGSNPNSSPKPRAEKAYHVRSTSLPCRSHPLISQLEDEIRSIRTWQLAQPRPEQNSSTAWLVAGMCHLELLHAALDDILQLPQTQDSLRSRRSSVWADNLLEDILRFADAYGSLRSELVSLQQIQSAAQVTFRRRDGARIASHARSMKKTEKEIASLVSALRDIGKSAETALVDGGDAELAGILREIKSVTVSVSASVLSGMMKSMAVTTSAVTAPSRNSWIALRTRLKSSATLSSPKKSGGGEESWGKALERLEALEECLKGLELGSERVYRSLIHTRVSLLNILTP